MKLSLKDTLMILFSASVFGVLNLLFAIPFWLLFLCSMSVAALWWPTISLIRNRKRGGVKKWIENFDGKITFNTDGLFISKPSHELSIPWKNLVKVELCWEENPWGDPQFGRYCDTDWLLWSESGKATSITESVNKTNSKVLLKAFERNLPGFKFDYTQFNVAHKNRLFEFEGGKVTVWTDDSHLHI
jgi:hypothetical protein